MALRKRPKASAVEDVEGEKLRGCEAGYEVEYDLINVCN